VRDLTQIWALSMGLVRMRHGRADRKRERDAAASHWKFSSHPGRSGSGVSRERVTASPSDGLDVVTVMMAAHTRSPASGTAAPVGRRRPELEPRARGASRAASRTSRLGELARKSGPRTLAEGEGRGPDNVVRAKLPGVAAARAIGKATDTRRGKKGGILTAARVRVV